MMLKIQLLIAGVNYVLMYFKIENSYFKLEKDLLFLLNVLLVSIKSSFKNIKNKLF